MAGPYHRVTDSYTGQFGTYPLGVFCRQSLAEFLDADDVFTITKQGFAYFESQFGVAYPFGKYDQSFVPEFNAGAMENAGCVTHHEDYVFRSRVTDAAYEQRSNTILHELAHMWFGDLVTMTWWDDLWLNESFAEWAAHWANANATRHTDAWTTFANLRKAWAYRQDQLPSTHPIAADMVDLDSVRVNFDGITYAKGASALRQLVAWVGEEEFLAGVRNYFVTHAWGNTELRDLLTELEATSGRDLSEWTAEWLQTSGVNLLRPSVEVAADGTYVSVVIEQEPPSSPAGIAPTLRSHRIALGLYDVTESGLVRRERLEIDVVGARTEVPQLAGVRQPDLLLVNDDDLTFAKIRLDERSWDTVAEHLGALVDPLARALVWGAAWDMTRDAEVSTGDFLRLVLSGIDRESDIGVVQGVLRQLKSAIDQFAAPEHRTDYLVRLATAVQGHAEAAEPGSDHQLAFTRGFVSAAHDGRPARHRCRAPRRPRRVGRPGGRYRPALVDAAAPRGHGPARGRRDRGRAGRRRHRHRTPAGGRRPRGPSHGGGQGPGLGGDRRAHGRAQRDHGGVDRRLRPARPGRSHAPLPGSVLRRPAAGVGAAHARDGTGDHDGPVPDAPRRRRDHRRHRRLPRR